MFTSNMQTAENGMAQRQYYSKIGSNFSSKMEVLTSESTLVDLSWYHLHFNPLVKPKQLPLKLLTHKTQN